MSQRDSVPDDLKLWRAAVVPVEPDLQEACRPATVQAIRQAMTRTQKARTRQRWLRGALLAAGVAAMGAGIFFVASSPRQDVANNTKTSSAVVEARARVETGSAEITRASEHHVLSGDRSMALNAGDVVRVGKAGSLVVTLPDAGSSEWHEGSVLDVREIGAKRQGFNLRRGHVAVQIPVDAPHRHLVVGTPHVDVVVVGTVFDVSVFEEAGEQVTEVSVQRGHVDLTRKGRTVAHLAAGQSWSSRSLKTARTERPKDEPRRVVKRTTPPEVEASSLREQNALYRAALDARNAGRDDRAVALLSQLLSQFPQSPLAQEAKVERFRALRRLGRDDEASQAARRYLAEYGDGFARDEAREAALPSTSE